MPAKDTRVRKKGAGFVGVNLAKDGDLSLADRLTEEVKATTMNRSLIIRLALIEYFEKRDNQKSE